MTATVRAVDTALYVEVSQFYAHQMQSMDAGDADAWAESFTEDGVFEANAHAEAFVGREVIRIASAEVAAQLVARGIQRRHWLGMLAVDVNDDGSLVARTYAQILETEKRGSTEVRMSTTCEDTLVRVDGRLQVQHRVVHRDDLD